MEAKTECHMKGSGTSKRTVDTQEGKQKNHDKLYVRIRGCKENVTYQYKREGNLTD